MKRAIISSFRTRAQAFFAVILSEVNAVNEVEESGTSLRLAIYFVTYPNQTHSTSLALRLVPLRVTNAVSTKVVSPFFLHSARGR